MEKYKLSEDEILAAAEMAFKAVVPQIAVKAIEDVLRLQRERLIEAMLEEGGGAIAFALNLKQNS